MIFSFRPVGRLLGGAALLVAPALLLVPGCGGGGSGTSNFTSKSASGVELIDNSDPKKPVIFDRANLTINEMDTAASEKPVSGTLQILGKAVILPSSDPDPLPSGLPAQGTLNIYPLPASYLLKGTATDTGSYGRFSLNVRGGLNKDVPFTLTGDLRSGQILVLRAQFKSGTVVIPMRVVDKPFAFIMAAPTPAPTLIATATPTGTATATTTATPTGTATSTPTVGITPASTPVSPVGGTPPSPVGTPPSPIGSPI